MNWEERRTDAGKYAGFDELGNTRYKVNHSQMLKRASDERKAIILSLIEDGYTDEEIEEYLDSIDYREIR